MHFINLVSAYCRIFQHLLNFLWKNIYLHLGKDSCSGDSGGPLISYEGVNDFGDLKYLRGIVSFGPKRCGNVSKFD